MTAFLLNWNRASLIFVIILIVANIPNKYTNTPSSKQPIPFRLYECDTKHNVVTVCKFAQFGTDFIWLHAWFKPFTNHRQSLYKNIVSLFELESVLFNLFQVYSCSPFLKPLFSSQMYETDLGKILNAQVKVPCLLWLQWWLLRSLISHD